MERLIHDSYLGYINDLFHSNTTDKDNKKKLFNFVKRQRNDQHGISSLKYEEKVVDDAKTKATFLNNYFTSVFTSTTDTYIPDKVLFPHPTMPDITVTPNGVQNLLTNLQSKKLLAQTKFQPDF